MIFVDLPWNCIGFLPPNVAATQDRHFVLQAETTNPAPSICHSHPGCQTSLFRESCPLSWPINRLVRVKQWTQCAIGVRSLDASADPPLWEVGLKSQRDHYDLRSGK